VCLSVPSIVGRHGVEGLLAVPMNASEETGLRASAEAIQRVVRELGF
jgi:L-lactate dehydrogenase